MDQLPYEMVDRINSFLDIADLKRTLFVSRQFQEAAEWYSGAFEKFVFCDSLQTNGFPQWTELEDQCVKFLNTFRGRRSRYLRHLEVHTGLPVLGIKQDLRPPTSISVCPAMKAAKSSAPKTKSSPDKSNKSS
ncbi:hypothetical protein P171DRAFT_430760 [Karstenula rhodostoma CBS 690.94]|uniref:F-box domain-containing protein n=1 Tax=Karstenula rhodostoma CBS 690.94 TaxID=1392251 RepID=A0A9P4PNT7_9PLEO|nr:hypothetical protein P171DRAFT_430760 [Karstenula rhodostoma CBS 690.94]